MDICKTMTSQYQAALSVLEEASQHYPLLDKLELQVYTIRHLQLHTGELAARLSSRGIETHRVGREPA